MKKSWKWWYRNLNISGELTARKGLQIRLVWNRWISFWVHVIHCLKFISYSFVGVAITSISNNSPPPSKSSSLKLDLCLGPSICQGLTNLTTLNLCFWRAIKKTKKKSRDFSPKSWKNIMMHRCILNYITCNRIRNNNIENPYFAKLIFLLHVQVKRENQTFIFWIQPNILPCLDDNFWIKVSDP